MRFVEDLLPAMSGFRVTEQVRAAAGALIGLCLCSLLVVLNGYVSGPSLMLVAPLGATAVLVFAIPNSPLAQPWSAVVGNVISALVALAALIYVPAPWTGGVAVGGAILAMMLARALHPPGGAVALLSVLDPDPVLEAGAWFALMPVGVTTGMLVCVAVIYNRLTGRVYPFRHVDARKSQVADPRLGLSSDELGELLVRFNQSTNLGVADLGRLLAAAEEEAAQHRFDGTTCADIMTRDVITARPDVQLPELAKLFRQNRIKSIPITDMDGALIGLVLQADLMAPLIAAGSAKGWRRNRAQIKASDLMRPVTDPVSPDLSVGHLLNRFAVPGTEVVTIVEAKQLVGILTRSDIVNLLLKGAEERQVA